MDQLPTLVGAVGLSTAVIFAYLVFIWWLDRYEREPFWVVLIAFGWGAVGGSLLGCLLGFALGENIDTVVPAAYADLATVVVVAPLAEEFTKGLVFALLVLTPHVDNETDGLIYGAAAGLGFAAVENVLYFLATFGEPEVFYATVVVRTLFTSLMHAISTALLGYAVGYVRHRPLRPWRWLWPVVGFVLAAANHGLWNLLALIAGTEILGEDVTDIAMGLGMTFVFLMAAAMFLITQLSLMREQKIIGEYLEDEARRGTLPHSHAEVIPSWRKRRKSGWLPPEVPHQEYVEAATLLAFRRYQADTAADKHRPRYRQKVGKYRRKVRQYLAGG